MQGIIQQIGAESAQANISTSSSVITAQSVCVLGMSYSQILPFHKVTQSPRLQLKRLSIYSIIQASEWTITQLIKINQNFDLNKSRQNSIIA